MQIVIEMPIEVKQEIDTWKGKFIIGEYDLIDAIKNGTVLPDNPTNGDMIKAMFPNDTFTIPLKSIYGLLEKIAQLPTQENEEGQDMYQAYDVLRTIREYCEVKE